MISLPLSSNRRVLIACLRRGVGLAAWFGAVLTGAAVEAVDLPPAVTVAFRGELVAIPSRPKATHSDKQLIAALKAVRLAEVTGERKEDTMHWSLRFLAFPTKAGAGKLKLEFHTHDKDGRYAADQLVEDVPRSAPCYELAFEISEDDGVMKDRSYVIKLVDERNGVIASTTLTLK